MFEKVYGRARNPVVVAQLVEQLDKLQLTGTLYVAYPILASADETIFVDALLVCQEHGLIVFLLADQGPQQADASFWQSVQEEQDRVYFSMQTNLGRHQGLRRGRDLGVPINVVTVFPADIAPPAGSSVMVCGPGSLGAVLAHCKAFPSALAKALNAAIQRVTTIKPVKKRTGVIKSGSRGAILKEIEREIANLDQWQKRAAIECPDGPQRIRGLAGSGKTVVLALKAAYMHAQNPDWTIALTFHTRSLYQQLTDLVRRFCFEHLNDEPNWDKLKVIHAWGSPSRPGVYAEMAGCLGAPIRDFLYAKSTHGYERAFHGVCQELLTTAKSQEVRPIYDAVLIDEAQDLPLPFFQLVHRFVSVPKRIVWAYDELQNLTDATMPTLTDMFGANVSLRNDSGQPRQNTVLPVCYRNTRWALTLAHALGFGIYREEGLVQLFDDPSLWDDIGYRVVTGSPEPGGQVSFERKPDSYPPYFDRLLQETDAVVCNSFGSEEEQAEACAKSIETNLRQDELEPDDIVVILPDALTARKRASLVMDALARRSIKSHVAGVTTSQDQMFSSDSVALSSVFRAKGNEAPMVYVLNCQHFAGGYELIKRRNALFTSITRSRCWVRLFGWGPRMAVFSREVSQIRDHGYRLEFRVPTPPELAQLRMIHRDRTAAEKARLENVERGLEEFLKLVESGELSLEALPQDLRKGLKELR